MDLNAASSVRDANPVTKLLRGDVGLAVSYWSYGVGAGLVWAVVFALAAPEPGSAVAKAMVVCMAAYFAVAYVGIWRAASMYQGKKAWATLAKFSVFLGFLLTILPVIAAVVAATTS